MSRGLYFVVFVMGAAAGTAATWHYVKKKYEKIAQEEIDSVKAVFAKKEDDDNKVREENRQVKDKPDLVQYAAMVQKYRGTVDEKKDPYVIPPEEFGEFDDYEKISLTYYADEILTDDNDDMIDDVEDIVGDALEHFGEYEEDSVFVRCDERKCDYEILLDQRNFSDVVGNKPHQVEV